tara:strand:+ start:57 stop:371 length:315 start_codon:yes stop_codon:yes gene_type:complete
MGDVIGMNSGKPQKASAEPQGGGPKIDLGKSKPIVCESCGYDTFVTGGKFRKISKLLTGTPQDVIIPIDIFICGNCGEVCDELMPPELRALEQLDKQKKLEESK